MDPGAKESNFFFRLPAELRIQIYSHVLPMNELIQLFSTNKAGEIRKAIFQSELQQTCRAIREECIALFVGTNRFSVAGVRTAIIFLSLIGETGRANLKNLHLGLMKFPEPPSQFPIARLSRAVQQGLNTKESNREFNLETLAPLLGSCVRLSGITLYISADGIRRLARGNDPGWEFTFRKRSGFMALKEALRVTPIESECRTRRWLKINWIGMRSLHNLFTPSLYQFMLEVTEWLEPDDGCVPHGEYEYLNTSDDCPCKRADKLARTRQET
jgi:hypothetical protein